jgi:hypothetical protein
MNPGPRALADNLPPLDGMTNKNARPYWLDGGSETCELCDHPYVLQSEYRCAACDRASCEHCVTVDRETGEVLCHECAKGEEEG